MATPRRIVLCAGEASGDALGAGLIARLRERFPDAQFAGIGGDRMRATGLDAWFDSSELALFGLFEVLAHLPRLLKIRNQFRRRVLDFKPDMFIGIDAPDFNLGVEKWLKQRGVTTVHYVSPSVWAWREKRAQKIGESARRVLCLFPMEPPIYEKYAIDARFVGHPMADELPLEPDRHAARERLHLPDDAPVLAVLPGSRLGEISRLGEPFLEAAKRVAEQIPNLRIVVPAANAKCKAALKPLLDAKQLRHVQLLDGLAREAMIASDAVLLASGTATLEAMLCKRPMVVGYKVSPVSAGIARALKMLKTTRFALPNILADADLAPEFMQEDCTPENLAIALLHWLQDEKAVAALQPRYLELHALLRKDASSSAAQAIAELLDENPRDESRRNA